MNLLYTGVNQRGFGTWPLTGDTARRAVLDAVEVGYRAFDTAQMYGNEAEVGAALAECGVRRSDLCITTKVRPDNFDEPRFLPSVEASIAALGGEPPDILLLHWPTLGGGVVHALKLLQGAFDRGMVKAIGVSNYTIAQLETAVSVLDTLVTTNQVEFHPLLDQSKLLAAASRLGVPMSAYCSIARGKIFDHPELARIGEAHGKSAPQVSLRWILQKGVSPIAMSTKPANMRANFDIMDFSLSNVELAEIDALAARVHYRITESVQWAPEWDV